MADLSELDRAGAIKIAGANPSTGIADNYLEVDTSGRITIKLTDAFGSAIALGQTTMAASVPVVIASNQSAIPISNFPTTVDTNYGSVGASTLRTAAQIGNATGAASFGSGATGAQTLRVSSNVSDGSGNTIGSDTGNPGIQYLRVSAVQSIVASTNNSSTSNLTSGSSFTGIADIALGQSAIEINIIADQPLAVQVQQSSDGTHWDISDTYYTNSNDGDARTFQSLALYWRIIVTNIGTATTAYFRLQSALVPFANPLPRALTEGGNLPVAINEISPFGPNATQLFDDTYDTGTDTINRWNAGISAGGGVAASNTPGSLTVGTGTTANGYSYITTQYIFQQRAPGWLMYMNAVNLEFPITNNTYRFWGWGNPQTVPTAANPFSDAIGYEVTTTGKLIAVAYSSGVRNVIQDLSTSTGNMSQPVDNKVHKYYIWFRGDISYWSIDYIDNVIATMRTGAPGPTVNALPVVSMAIAGSVAPSSSGVLTSNALFVGDTTQSTIRISDGTFGWRKATVDTVGNIAVKDYSDGASGSAAPPVVSQIGGTDGTNLRALSVDTTGRIKAAGSSYFHPTYSLRVQAVSGNSGALATSLVIPINSTSSGNFISVMVGSSVASTVTVTDNLSQTYSTAISGTTGTHTNYIFYKANTAAGVTSITISSTISSALVGVVMEYFGVSTSSPLDKTSTGTVTLATAFSSGATATTTSPIELLLGSAYGITKNNQTYTPGTNWSSVGTSNGFNAAAGQLYVEDQYVSSVGAYTATGTASGSDTIVSDIATFIVTNTNLTIINQPKVVKSGSGILRRIAVNTIGTGSPTVTLYDNTTNSGTIIGILSLSTVGSLDYNLNFTNGLTVVASSTTGDFTLIYD